MTRLAQAWTAGFALVLVVVAAIAERQFASVALWGQELVLLVAPEQAQEFGRERMVQVLASELVAVLVLAALRQEWRVPAWLESLKF